MESDVKRQRLRTTSIVVAGIIAILAIPWVLMGLRQLAWQVQQARAVSVAINGETVEVGDGLSALVPLPDDYDVVGTSDYMADGGNSAVVGLTARGSMSAVTADYRGEMLDRGWQQVSSDERSLSMGFTMPDKDLDAYVLYREYVAGTVSIVIQIHRVAHD